MLILKGIKMSIPLVKQAQYRVASYLKAGDTAIDATMGNGFDTIFLAEKLANIGQIYAFDVQQQALDATSSRLKSKALNNCYLIHDSHEKVLDYLEKDSVNNIRCTMFNLGYLPSSDKAHQTSIDPTLKALDSCLSILDSPGIISVIAYTGHPGGREETEAVKAWANNLNTADYSITIEIPKTLKSSPPELIFIETN